MQITKPLSVKLQGRGEEIHCAVNSVKDCIAVMQQIRDDDTFDAVFQAATEICREEITMPCLTARQRNRTKVPATNAADYYRRAVFLPFVDCCILQMTERFTPHAATANHLIVLLPTHCDTSDFSDVATVGSFYAKFLPGGNVTALRMEFMRWQQLWKRQGPEAARPQSAVETLRLASEFGTYPASATADLRHTACHDSYRRKKLQCAEVLEKLPVVYDGRGTTHGLAHLYINRDISVTTARSFRS